MPLRLRSLWTAVFFKIKKGASRCGNLNQHAYKIVTATLMMLMVSLFCVTVYEKEEEEKRRKKERTKRSRRRRKKKKEEEKKRRRRRKLENKEEKRKKKKKIVCLLKAYSPTNRTGSPRIRAFTKHAHYIVVCLFIEGL